MKGLASAALAAGVVAAVALPGNRLGLGVVLVAIALSFVARPAHVEVRGWQRIWAGLALLLAVTPLVRDATWVVVPALGGALAFASLAMAGGATWAGVSRGLVAAIACLPAGGLVVARAAALVAPRPGRGRLAPVARGAALAVGLVALFGVLFASGDRAFAQLAGDALPRDADLGLLPQRLLALVGVAALGGALVVAHATARGAGPSGGGRRRGFGPTEWLIGLVALDALFAAFVAVQFAVLFGHDEHVLRTAGLTYAEYAREGFAELLVVAALSLAVVLAALRSGNRAIRVALGVLCALTFVVLASAIHRLDLYQDAFGATRLRFAADAALLLVGALLATTLAATALGRAGWLPRTWALVAGLWLVGLVAVNPDGRIAERNVDRLAATGQVDAAYLGTLSADAVPSLPRRFTGEQRRRLAGGDGWAGFSVARARARDALR